MSSSIHWPWRKSRTQRSKEAAACSKLQATSGILAGLVWFDLGPFFSLYLLGVGINKNLIDFYRKLFKTCRHHNQITPRSGGSASKEEEEKNHKILMNSFIFNLLLSVSVQQVSSKIQGMHRFFIVIFCNSVSSMDIKPQNYFLPFVEALLIPVWIRKMEDGYYIVLQELMVLLLGASLRPFRIQCPSVCNFFAVTLYLY